MTKQAKAASSGARGPRGSYAKTAEVRQKILDACVEAFGAGGFHGATMKGTPRKISRAIHAHPGTGRGPAA
ncbi:hypothetical protein [Streptomyces sp. B21-083]|uniref:hypothetical protein n=1 Tax=Streptomyces sp. B21-083 TaxID=3039410 RepID=UPI002FF097EC